MSLKNPVTTPGIDPGTVRLVAQRLNHYATPGPSLLLNLLKKKAITDCSNYRAVSLLATAYRILSCILLSRLTACSQEIIGDHQCVFRRNTTGQLLIIYSAFVKYLRKKWEYIEALHLLFVDSRVLVMELGVRFCIIFSLSLVSP